MQLVAVADDLSGATETLAALGLWGSKVWLNTDNPKALLNEIIAGQDLVIDSNSRPLSRVDAKRKAQQIAKVLSNLPEDALAFRKIDSLLRGNIATEVEEALNFGPVIFAPANPKTGRTTVDAVVHVNGAPLHMTDLWNAENSKPWDSITHALGKIPSVPIALQVVREGREKLVQTLKRQAKLGQVIICDAETDADLDAIAAAALQVGKIQIFGTAGLARAIARIYRPNTNSAISPTAVSQDVLVVVGSIAEASKRQVEELGKNGIKTFTFRAQDGEVPKLEDAVRSSLVLTGGETARVFLETLGISWVRPFEEIENGMIASSTSTSQVVVIKPGSYGDDQTLIRAVNYIKNYSKMETSQQ
jgi:4-hydroxythreonine-4-phosphate dehydrogenase